MNLVPYVRLRNSIDNLFIVKSHGWKCSKTQCKLNRAKTWRRKNSIKTIDKSVFHRNIHNHSIAYLFFCCCCCYCEDFFLWQIYDMLCICFLALFLLFFHIDLNVVFIENGIKLNSIQYTKFICFFVDFRFDMQMHDMITKVTDKMENTTINIHLFFPLYTTFLQRNNHNHNNLSDEI